MKIETINLNNKEYVLIEKININNVEYYILANEFDNKDLCVRKKIIENNEEYLVGLESEEEFNLVMSSYLENKKRKNLKRFYPIGTIVNLKDFDLEVMIIGYSMINSKGVKYDYCGCIYPLGISSKKDYLFFDKRNITKIIKVGCMNKEVKEVLTKVELSQ